jgi:TATA-box binding protein (TBP) (component of TFIID and TFIIIB)
MSSIENNQLDKLQILTGLKSLPSNLSVSTMTIICEFDCKFNINNIGKYVELSEDGIQKTKYATRIKKRIMTYNNTDKIRDEIDEAVYEDITRVRMIPYLEKKIKSRKQKKQDTTFYNQTELKIRCKVDDYTVKHDRKDRQKKISVKLFRNGTAHFTGCATINGLCEAVKILCNELKKTRAIVDYSGEEPKLKEIEFSTNPSALEIEKIVSSSISLINANFSVNFEIDRLRLKKLMDTLGHECTYNPIKYSGVKIRYNYRDIKKVAILVFKSGSIVITGGRSCNQVKKAYNFICNILNENYQKIVEVDSVSIKEHTIDDKLSNLLKERDDIVSERVMKLIGMA